MGNLCKNSQCEWCPSMTMVKTEVDRNPHLIPENISGGTSTQTSVHLSSIFSQRCHDLNDDLRLTQVLNSNSAQTS